MPFNWYSEPIKAIAISSLGLALIGTGAAAQQILTYEQIDELERGCSGIQYSGSQSNYYSGLFKIKVEYNPAYFDQLPEKEEGTAFLVDNEQGLLMTALHTLVPEERYFDVSHSGECKFRIPDPESLTVTTRVFSRSDPSDNKVVELQIVDEGSNGCLDTALLKTDPANVSGARRFEISHSLRIEGASGFRMQSSNAVTPQTPAVPVVLSYTKYSVNIDECNSWLPICCEQSCLLASNFSGQGGVSGSPLLDAEGRVQGMFIKEAANNNQSVWAMPMWHVDNELILNKLELKISSEETLKTLAQRDDFNKLADPSLISNLRFYKILDEVTKFENAIDLEPKRLICPILVAAKARGLKKSIEHKLVNMALAYSRHAAIPQQSMRAHLREIGQEQFQLAQHNYGSGDLDLALTQFTRADSALDAAVAFYLNDSGVSSAATVSSIVVASNEADKQNAEFIAQKIAAFYGVDDWNVGSEAHKSKVLSGMLREIADTNVAIASLDDTNHTAAFKGATMAFWAKSVAPENSGAEARSFRTLGDALIRANMPDSARNAYIRALLAGADTDAATARIAYKRLKETSKITGVMVSDTLLEFKSDSNTLNLVQNQPLLDFAADDYFTSAYVPSLNGYDVGG